MHTSTRLSAPDFAYRRQTVQGYRQISFAEFCPDYHELDRVGVVSPRLEDGILHTGRTLLALTTAFYDCHRARGPDFFDYPQHFAFVGATEKGVACRSGRLALHTPHLWDAWSWLDVWPANKWVTALPTATEMVMHIFDYQINRLFWPLDLRPHADEESLPDYVYKMLRTRLKQVYYYSPSVSVAHDGPVVAVGGADATDTLLRESIARLPGAHQPEQTYVAPAVERFWSVPVGNFVAALQRIKP